MKGGIKKLVVSGDWHIPFHDIDAVNLFFKFIKKEQPDTIILNGDIVDCYKLFKNKQTPIDKGEFAHEVDLTRKILEKIRNLCPEAEIFCLEGNHEFRLRKYLINQAPELYKLFFGGFFDNSNAGTLMDYLLNCWKYKIEYVPLKENMNKYSHNFIQLQDVFIGHFDKVNKHAGYTCKNLREELGVSLIQSHTHRIGSSYRTFLDKSRFGLEIGCMCYDPTYATACDWQLGFLVAYLTNDNGFYPYQIAISEDYSFISPSGVLYQ
jgi:predicted phosphodiesterase